MTYPLIICNGYIVIEIDGQKFILDTGSGLSLAATKTAQNVTIGGRDFAFALHPQLAGQLTNATGLPDIMGIIGFNVIYAFGGIDCDIARGVATFGTPQRREGAIVPFEKPHDFHFHVRVNGQNALGFLDIGAPRAMVDDHSLLDGTLYEGMVDEPSASGTIHTEQYGGTMEFGGVTRTVHRLKSVRDMNRDGVSKVYFSILPFADKYFAIDLTNQEIRFL